MAKFLVDVQVSPDAEPAVTSTAPTRLSRQGKAWALVPNGIRPHECRKFMKVCGNLQ
jgi:hypothetical protein